MIEGSLDNLQYSTTKGSRSRFPSIAVEVAPEGVLAGSRNTETGSLNYAFADISDGDLIPAFSESNVRNSDTLTAALRAAILQVSPRRDPVTIIVPDSAARVFIVSFDTLPANRADITSLLRYRLRKLLPVDGDNATIAFQILTPPAEKGEEKPAGIRVLAVLMPSAVIAEYEGVVRAAGYQPGALLPSSIASLAAFDCGDGAVLVNVNKQGMTTCIGMGDDLLLYRSVDLPLDREGRHHEFDRTLAISHAWYEDHLGALPQRFCYVGSVSRREAPSIASDDRIPGLLALMEEAQPRYLGFAALAGALGARARGEVEAATC
jgi:type IV pilus assembly protein PilM